MDQSIQGELVPYGRTSPTRRPGNQAVVAERRERALTYNRQGYSYSQIFLVLMAGEYPTRAAVAVDIRRALDQRIKALAAPADEKIAEQLERLEHALTKVHEVLERTHYHVAGGKIVTRVVEYLTDEHGNIRLDEDGNPLAKQVEELIDDGPVLAAVDRLIKISESTRRLMGLDKPTKVNITGTVEHQYGTEIDQV
jgi:nucleoside diphosphate kinase